MKVPFNNLSLIHEPIREEIDQAIRSVVDSSQFIGKEGNRFVRAFEDSFCEFSRLENCIACANGTDAIEIALKALRIGQGDEVIVPARTWISTSEAVSATGAKPVFADTDPETHNLDTSRLESYLTKRTKAIIPVHLYGLPADMFAISNFARAHDLRIIEDSAQAHGASIDGQPIGSFGDFATFSFFPGKNLGAFGDAGCIVTKDPDLAARARRLCDHGRSAKDDHAFEGRNCRMDGIQAAVLSAKLPYLAEWTSKRQQVADELNQGLSDLPIKLPFVHPNYNHVYHLYVIETPIRGALRAFLGENKIQTGIHYPKALPFLEAYDHLNHTSSEFPVAKQQSNEILSLPIYPSMPIQQIEYLIEKIVEFFKSHPLK